MKPERYRNPLYVPQLLVNALNQTPHRPLVHMIGGPVLTVGQVRDATSQFIQALRALGVQRGTRVAVLSASSPDVLHVGHALMLLAAVSVPLHPRAGLGDQLRLLRETRVELLIIDTKHYGSRAIEIARELPALRLLSLGANNDGADDLCALAARYTPAALEAPEVDGDTVMRLSCSGGTTARPKIIPSTQRSALAAATIMLAEWEWPSPPHVLPSAPLSHAGGAMTLTTLLKQGTLFVQPKFDALGVLQAVQEHRINTLLLVPTMIYQLLDHPGFAEFDLSSLQTIFYGASAISPMRLKEAIERIGPVFFQFYGQAEAPMTITVMRKAEHDVSDPQRLASCGRPVPWLDVELLAVNEARRVPDGKPGEICVRGPLVMDGYVGHNELNGAVLRDGWLRTGDLAIRDPDGFLRIVGRTKDMIISGGYNIYPREIEDVLQRHPAVAQAAVFGVPDPLLGEAVKAMIQLRTGAAVTAEALIQLVVEEKGAYQKPRHLEFVDSLLVTALDKIDNKAMRANHRASEG